MIAKKFRLSENEVKKVLRKGKPFFSYTVVLNTVPNSLGFHRFAVVLGGKSVRGSVERNFFRRFFYTMMQESCFSTNTNFSFDLVFVVKKGTLLSDKNPQSVNSFRQELLFLYKKFCTIYER